MKTILVLVEILEENDRAFFISSEDGNKLWLSKDVITNDGGGHKGDTVVMDVFESIAVRACLI